MGQLEWVKDGVGTGWKGSRMEWVSGGVGQWWSGSEGHQAMCTSQVSPDCVRLCLCSVYHIPVLRIPLLVFSPGKSPCSIKSGHHYKTRIWRKGGANIETMTGRIMTKKRSTINWIKR